MYYDKEGKPLDLMEWANLFEDFEYRQVGDSLVDGIRVSTVWLGLDHNFGRVGPPLIFETMMFDWKDDNRGQDFQWRYSTLEQAQAGHANAVKQMENERLAIE